VSQFSLSALWRLGRHPFPVIDTAAISSEKRQRLAGAFSKYGSLSGCMAALTAPVVNRLSFRIVEFFARADSFKDV
jgi:hypothetical protein